MGICRLASASAGVPMFWYSGVLGERIGVEKVLVGTLAAYMARFLIYSTMRSPLQALPAEMLRGATFAMFWSTATIEVRTGDTSVRIAKKRAEKADYP